MSPRASRTRGGRSCATKEWRKTASIAVSVGNTTSSPPGYPFLLSLAFQLAGVEDWVAHALNNLLLAASIFLVFSVGLLLFGSPRAALGSALIYATIPMNAIWFATAAGEPGASFAALLAVCATLVFARAPSTAACWLALLANVIAIQFRSESILLVAVNVAILLCVRPNLLKQSSTYAWSSLACILALPHPGHLLAVRGESWGSEGAKFSLAAFQQKWPVNTSFYWDNERFPVLFTALAIVGLIAGGTFRRKMPLVAWFLGFWGVFLFFYAGSYNYGVDVRFSLLSYAPLALLGGLGADWLTTFLCKRLPRKFATAVVPAAVLLACMPFFPLVRTVGEEAWAARADVRLAREFAEMLPPNSIVLSHNPSLFLLRGRNAAQMSLATFEQSYVDDHFFRKYDGGVYLHYNYWCNVDNPSQSSFCTKLLKDYETTVLAEHRVRDFRYALYRVRKMQRNRPD